MFMLSAFLKCFMLFSSSFSSSDDTENVDLEIYAKYSGDSERKFSENEIQIKLKSKSSAEQSSQQTWLSSPSLSLASSLSQLWSSEDPPFLDRNPYTAATTYSNQVNTMRDV
ncbi:hypothetical protein VNO77_26019 [Canavalia gladiata]|uniref:Uncharacterized protein n=1 Tax=Canavalia gladiata TaxID=3824 RepID=A0AAN9KRM5_CANGL